MSAVSRTGQLERVSKEHSWVNDALLVIGASLLISLFGRIAIPLPFSPVPLAVQMNVCLLLGLLLGSKRAAAAVLLFLAQGALGMPVFAKGAGLAYLFGPTGGYLIGYVAGAYLAGFLWERAKIKTASRAFFFMAAGNLAVYTLGVAHLSHFIGLSKALLLGVVPFVLGDALKLLASVRLFNLKKLA